VASDNHSPNKALLQFVTALFSLLDAGCSTLSDQTLCSDLYSHFYVYLDSFWFTSDLHLVATCRGVEEIGIKVSVARRWQLALRRRLLQVTCQPGAA